MSDSRPAFDLQQFLRQYGIVIYTGDPDGDACLIEEEIKELRQLGIIEQEEYLHAMLALKRQLNRVRP